MSHPEAREDQRKAQEETMTDARAAASVELIALAKQIEHFRESRSRRPSDRAWTKQWPALGATKTLSNILKGNLSEIDPTRWLDKYRGVLTALRSNLEEAAEEELYDDITPAQSASLAVLRLMHHRGKDRLIIIEGSSGSGKTSILNILNKSELNGSMRMLEADDTWRSPRDFLGALLRSLGYGTTNRPIPFAQNARLEKTLEAIHHQGHILIAIDEAHHMTGTILNIVKTLINRTDAMFVLAGMDTLFRKLRASASEEAMQLYHNRLFARIKLEKPNPEDARVFLERRLEMSEGSSWKDSTLRQLSSTSLHAGMWAFLRRVVDILLAQGATTAEIDDTALIMASNAAAEEIGM